MWIESQKIGKRLNGNRSPRNPVRFIAHIMIKLLQGFPCAAAKLGKQFAVIQPSTKTRVDVGINLKGVEPTNRLEKSGSFNAMVSHRVRLSAKKDVDRELLAWLEQAYAAS